MTDTCVPVRLVYDEIFHLNILHGFGDVFVYVNNWLIFRITRLNIETKQSRKKIICVSESGIRSDSIWYQ